MYPHDDVAPFDDPLAPPSEAPPTGFAALELRPELLATLEALGYRDPTPIQSETIPLLLAGKDLLGQAATGTGKTAAFALPILQNIGTGAKPLPRALVLTPTRELAMQVCEAMQTYGAALGIQVIAVFGGQPIHHQLRALDRGVHVVVATPGRALDHIRRRSLRLDRIETVVLDEADEMLDMGFSEDLEAILEQTPGDRQTVLFSATLPPRINAIAKHHQKNPVRVRIGRGDATPGNADVEQSVYLVSRKHKAAALGRILDMESPGAALVFCKTRADVDDLTEVMMGRGYRAESLHGGMDQPQRDRVMGRLRDGTAELLIATDVAARGLDVDRLTHVVNYDVPTAPESYVHRIGRVGRAGREGVAITLVEQREKRLLRNIERLTKQSIAVKDLPTVADVRANKLRQTSVRIAGSLDGSSETTEDGDLESYRSVLDTLSADHDIETIALATIRLLHQTDHPGDDVEIPALVDRTAGKKRSGGDDRSQRRGQDRGRAQRGGSPADTRFVYIGVGGKARIRPGDLVGAIANNTSLSGKQIGPIRISDHHSVVGVPAEAVDEVISTMHGMHLRGKKAKARRYTD
jgi:ATP-dependent RNA helicase DeaD